MAERTTREEGGIHFITHSIRRREGGLGGLRVKFPVGLPEGEAAITVVDPVATNVTLYVEHKFKAEFIKSMRAALDEWERN